MTEVIATARNDELLLAAVLAGVALLFLFAGVISAWVGRRSRRAAPAATDRDGPDADAVESSAE
jgi:uncharacterized membrane protein YqjE